MIRFVAGVPWMTLKLAALLFAILLIIGSSNRRGRGPRMYWGAFGRDGRVRPYAGIYMPVRSLGAVGVGRHGGWVKFRPRVRQ